MPDTTPRAPDAKAAKRIELPGGWYFEENLENWFNLHRSDGVPVAGDGDLYVDDARSFAAAMNTPVRSDHGGAQWQDMRPLRPETAQGAIIGWVCVSPDGVVGWRTARVGHDEAMEACFGYRWHPGPRDDWWQKNLDEGWRCVPLAPAQGNYVRSLIASEDAQAGEARQ